MGRRQNIFDMTGGRCFYCGCKLDFNNFHIDHFTAKKRGGKQKDNLVPSCPDCNLSKGDMTVEEFRNKISNIINATVHGRMICKYYGVYPKQIKFFFEEVKHGTIQDSINEFLDRQQSCR